MTRALARRWKTRDDECGFTMVELVVAVVIIFGGLLALMSTATVGLVDAALARQRQTATGIANQLLEQIRGLPYETVGQGLADNKLAQDPNITLCPDGEYYIEACPSANPASEKIVHTAGIPDAVPLVPNVGSVGAPTYSNTYSWRTYVTRAQGVPAAGAYRATVVVSWNPTVRHGAQSSVRAQTLIYKGAGSTDPSTAGSGAGSFFTADSALTKGSVKVTPNAGVAGGTGVTGLSSWDSITQELPALATDMQTQGFTRAEALTTLSGATKVVGGVPTDTGGATSVAKADDNSATPLITSSDTPPGVSQSVSSVDIAGGGNRIGAGELAPPGGGGGAAPACPTTPPYLEHLTGYEHGSTFVGSSTTTGNIAVDSAQAHAGSYSLRINKVSGSSTSTSVERSYYSSGAGNLPQAPVKVVHFAVMFESLPAADVGRFFALTGDASANGAYMGYQASTQKLTLRFVSGGPVVTSSSTVTPGAWMVIDVRHDTADGTPAMDWQVNGVAQGPLAYGTGTYAESISFGSLTTAEAFTIRIDDVATSATAASYPLPDLKVYGLYPNGMGTSVNPGHFQHEDNSAIGPSTWQRLDDQPLASAGNDYVKQVTASASSYLELTMQDTAETCILGVIARAGINGSGSQTNQAKVSVFDGSTERVVHSGLHGGTGTLYRRLIITPTSEPWTQAALNGVKFRIGYGSDVNPVPYWQSLHLEYAVPPAGTSGGGGGGGGETPGNQSGSAAATTPPTSPISCYAVQTSGACSYAQLGFASPAPTLRTVVNLGGSGAGDCALFTHTPSLSASSTYGRRDTSANPTGSLVEDVVHYYGTNEFAGLCAGAGAAPSGWGGYLVKYEQGGSYSCAKAAAGLQAAYPRFCSVGTISYWNGAGVSTMAPTTDGAAIPVSGLDHTNGGWRYQLIPTLASAPSSVSDPSMVVADRPDASATLGAPITGTIRYILTNTTTGNVVVDLTMSIDLGSLKTRARYQA